MKINKSIKKILIVTLIPLTLTGCVANPVKIAKKLNQQKPVAEQSINENASIESESDVNNESSINVKPNVSGQPSVNIGVPVKVEDIEILNFTIKEPDSIGTVYMECKFKNNSDKPLSYISFEYKIGNETTYLSTYETLLPGETSAIVEAFGPESRNPEDVKLLSASYTIEDDSSIDVTYDAKLNKYSY